MDLKNKNHNRLLCTNLNIINIPTISLIYPGIIRKIEPKTKKIKRLFFSIENLFICKKLTPLKLLSKKSFLFSENIKQPIMNVIKISINETINPNSLKKRKKRVISIKGNKTISKIIFNF